MTFRDVATVQAFFDWLLIAALGLFTIMNLARSVMGLMFDGSDRLLRSRTDFSFGLTMLTASGIWRIIDPSIYSAPIQSHWFQMVLLGVAPLFLIGGIIGIQMESRLFRKVVFIIRDKSDK